MVECTIFDEMGLKWVAVKGRIDSMTAPQIQQTIDDLILSGERTMVVGLGDVNYVSSAGLRVFLIAEKQLRKAGGNLILFAANEGVLNVFTLSGFEQMFQIVPDRTALQALLESKTSIAETIETFSIDGIVFSCIQRDADASQLRAIGSQRPLEDSAYGQSDVVTVRAQEFQYGTGLAALGDEFDEYKQFFGESVTLNRHFFFYPAVKHSAVDFMLCSGGRADFECRYLHGFGYDGPFQKIVSFERPDGFVTLDQLSDALFQIAGTNLLGMVLLAESKGFWGIHLRKVPIADNRPANGKPIFDGDNFSEWMNFPVEASDVNHVIAGAGIAVKDAGLEPQSVRDLFPEGRHTHIHAGVFSKAPLGKSPDRFERELHRVVTELEAAKVQHVLGKTQFGSGMVGIVELKG